MLVAGLAIDLSQSTVLRRSSCHIGYGIHCYNESGIDTIPHRTAFVDTNTTGHAGSERTVNRGTHIGLITH
jgi:hypothetical protein